MKPVSLKFYFEGDDYFHDLWRDISHAQNSLIIESYIISDDGIGNHLKKLLITKARAGLKVFLTCDAIGSMDLPQSFLNELSSAGVHVTVYNPFKIQKLFSGRLNKRNHRKLIVIDDHIAYLGSMNLCCNHSKKLYGSLRWRDTQVRVTGHLAKQAGYNAKRRLHLVARQKRFEKMPFQHHIVTSKNLIGANKIRHWILRYIKKSRKTVWITTAYLIPDWALIHQLIKAKKRGVDVKILTNSDAFSDVPLVNTINRPLLKFLIKRGIEIFYYQNRMLHAKTAVFDDDVATIGSLNLNYRSFFRDHEINVFIRKPQWVNVLNQQFKEDINQSTLVRISNLEQPSLHKKFLTILLYPLRSFF